MNNTIIYIALIIAVFIAGFFVGREIKPLTNTIHHIDTVWVDHQLPPITFTDTINKTHIERLTDTKIIYDSTMLVMLDKAVNDRDSINKLLGKYYTETAKLDTIWGPNKDTLKLQYEIYNKIFGVDMRFGKVSLPQITKTDSIPYISLENKLLYGGIGMTAGILLTILIRNN